MEKKLFSRDEDVRSEEKALGAVGRGRSLRHKEKKLYTDEGIDDDEIEGRRTFNLDEKIRKALEPGQTFYVEMKGADVNLKYFQQNGFVSPILVRDKAGLGLRMPSENFTVDDVKRCVGSYRMLDVVDVTTQKDLTMSVKEWVRYYTSPSRERLLNVISLEFSHTKLENYVDQPEVIHQMDWVDLAWPWYLKEYQTEATNVLDRMMYPKVQKYCLMSVKGCYTDFHIDMGGTSVWYHILKGKKVFWLIPPTEENLQAYESWTLSAKQGDIFFGDMVSSCYHITLEAGWTFFIPTGWIHAVYTPEDSLVFGGNFLHSFGIQMQLRIWEVETRTHVPTKFRYPLFCELHWYVLERYVSCLMCRNHRIKSAEEICLEDGKTYEQSGEGKSGRETIDQDNCKKESESSEKSFATSGPPVENIGLSMDCDGDAEQIESGIENKTANETQHLTSRVSSSRNVFEAVFNIITDDKICELEQQNCSSRRLPRNSGSDCGISRKSFDWIDMTKHERDGLSAIVLWLEKLPQTKKFIPKDIPDPLGLLTDVKSLLKSHSADSHEKAVNGQVILTWPVRKKRRQKKMVKAFSTGNTGGPSQNGTGMWHYRRVRCRECEPCTRADCGDCYFCRDMRKFGGPGRKKQTCVSRQCLAPMLPSNAICQICNQGDGATAIEGASESFVSEEQLTRIEIMECRICFDIVHPLCLKKSHPEISHPGVVDEDLPSSWECARCCEAGKEGQGKQRHKFFTVPPESSARRRHRRESSGSSSSSGSCNSSESVKSKRSNQICSKSGLHSGYELVQSPQRKRQGVSHLELPFQLKHTQSIAVDQTSSLSVLCGSSLAVHTKDLDDSSSIQKRTDILKISLSPEKKSASGVESWKIARVEMGNKKKNFQIKDLKPTLTQNAINTDDCGKRKKRVRPGNSGSAFDSTPEANAVHFTSPLRINSHGREIMTPRRYLI